MKKCRICGESKPLNDFYPCKTAYDNLMSECKICNNLNSRKYKRTIDGLLSSLYSDQHSNALKRGIRIEYSKSEFKQWVLSQRNFNSLYLNWSKSNYDKLLRPSVDRLLDYKHYFIGNIQLITWGEHLTKTGLDTKNGINNKRNKKVFSYNISTNEKQEFHSISEASRTLNIALSSISNVCNNKIASVRGYKFKFG